jgi:hypothetical protein
MANGKLKTAICISGHFRSFDKSIASFRKHLFNNPYIDYDVFVHTWDAIDRDVRPGISKERLMDELNPKQIIIEPQKRFPITSLMTKQNFNSRDINGLLCMFYKIQECNVLKSQYEKLHGFTYDCVMRLRGDIQFHEDVQLHPNLDLNKLHIPAEGDYAGLNDQLAFSNSKNMDIYSSIYSNIERYLESGLILNPELFVKQIVIENDIKLERPSLEYVILWSNGSIWHNKTRFKT